MKSKPRLFTRLTLVDDDVQREERAFFRSGVVRYTHILTSEAGGEVTQRRAKFYGRKSASDIPRLIESLRDGDYIEVE